eukprot:14035546-Alexandrium_andersonii.AAC.1
MRTWYEDDDVPTPTVVPSDHESAPAEVTPPAAAASSVSLQAAPHTDPSAPPHVADASSVSHHDAPATVVQMAVVDGVE